MNQKSYPLVPTHEQRVRLASLTERVRHGTRSPTDSSHGGCFSPAQNWRRYCASVWLEHPGPDHRESLAPLGLYRHPAFNRHGSALRTQITLLYSANFPLQAAKRSHAARLSDRNLERNHRLRLRRLDANLWI